MYYIVKKNNDGETVNIVSSPSTGEPLGFYDIMDAIEFSENYGFTGQGVDVVDLDEEKLRGVV